MTFADGLKPVVSWDGSMPRKPLYINLSLLFQKVGQGCPKSLLCGSLRGISPKEYATTLVGGGHFDCESIQSFQPNSTQLRCQNCYCEEWISLQAQHQLSHYMDSKIQKEITLWEGERSAK